MKKIYLLLLLAAAVTTSQAQTLIRITNVTPNIGMVVVCNFGITMQNLSQYRISATGMQDTPLYKLATFYGKADSAAPSVPIYFKDLPLPKNCGSVSLYLPGDTVNHLRGALNDFMQFGCAGNENEDSAQILGLWTKGDYIKGGGPYIFNSNSTKYGVTYWSSSKLPIIIIRFATLSLWRDMICIKNAGVSNIDMQYSTICVNGTCYDSLKNAPVQIVKGNMNIQKNDSLILRITGAPLDTVKGSIALFVVPNSLTDTTALLDFVQWGAPQQPFASLAHKKGIWDSMEYVTIVRSQDSLKYIGNYTRSQVGKSYWQSCMDIRLNMITLNQLDFSTSPNPAKEVLTLSGVDLVHYDIYDLQGRIINSANLNGLYSINTSTLKSGLYILSVTDRKGMRGTTKLMVTE